MSDLVINAIHADPTRSEFKIEARLGSEPVVLEMAVKPDEIVGRILKYDSEVSVWLRDHPEFSRPLSLLIFAINDHGLPMLPIALRGLPEPGPKPET